MKRHTRNEAFGDRLGTMPEHRSGSLVGGEFRNYKIPSVYVSLREEN